MQIEELVKNEEEAKTPAPHTVTDIENKTLEDEKDSYVPFGGFKIDNCRFDNPTPSTLNSEKNEYVDLNLDKLYNNNYTPKICKSCGELNEKDAVFCKMCGVKLN